jgi:hypothetical protein
MVKEREITNIDNAKAIELLILYKQFNMHIPVHINEYYLNEALKWFKTMNFNKK